MTVKGCGCSLPDVLQHTANAHLAPLYRPGQVIFGWQLLCSMQLIGLLASEQHLSRKLQEGLLLW